ncbi:N-acetyltransferase [uncultured Gammaproteobacteria bacterium]
MTAYRKLLPTELFRYRDHLLRLDAEDRHARFAGTVSDDSIRRHCKGLDWTNTVVIGYFDQGELRGASELRFESGLRPERAELAFSIEKPFQNHGMGASLMRRALTVARNRGIETIDIICLMENRRMQRLARKYSKYVVTECGEVDVSIPLNRASPVSVMLETIEDGAGAVSTLMDQTRGLLGFFYRDYLPPVSASGGVA